MKVYTKTGDSGQTGLIGGKRVDKDDARIELYGTVDELNSSIGVVASTIEDSQLIKFLHQLQAELFNLGSNLACEKKEREKFKLKEIDPNLVGEIEKMIDQMESELNTLKNFILPGGCLSASHTHVARTICRRTERRLITFEKENSREEVPGAVVFLNRLSDYLFVLARYCNLREGIDDIPWA